MADPQDERQFGAMGARFERWTRSEPFWICLLLIVLGLAVYAPVAHHEFTNLDDPLYVTRNVRVAAGLTWRGLAWAFTTGHAGQWHPLTWLSHMLDVELFGVKAGAHHLVNVALHLGTTLLLFGALARMTGQARRSAAVAALFAVHPLHVESVAWVAERKDVLSALFFVLTLWAYDAYVERPERRRFLAVVGVFALGLMAKPILVTLPFVLLLLDVWPLRRISLGEGAPRRREGARVTLDRETALALVKEKIPLFALALVSSAITLAVHARSAPVEGVEVLSLWRRLVFAIASYGTYLVQMIWPTDLAVIYPYPSSPPWLWALGSLAVLVAVSATAVRLLPRAPYVAVGWFWYLGMLVPVIGLVQIGAQPWADRHTYLPLIGLFIVLAWGAPALLGRWRMGRLLLPIAVGLVLVACAAVAARQVRFWKDSEALWTRAVDVTSRNHLAHNHLGSVLSARGRPEKAMTHFTEALRIRPSFVEVNLNMGNTLAAQGRFDDALVAYAALLKARPDFAQAHNNAAVILARQGRVDQAMAHYAEALRIRPDMADAHNNLGFLLARRGQVDEAVIHYRTALRLKPDLADAHRNLGLALAAQGRIDDAILEFKTALLTAPNDAEAHFNLAAMYGRKRQRTDAVRHYEEVVRINPADAETHYRLGVILAGEQQPERAMRHLEAALRIDPRLEKARRALAEVSAATRGSGPPGPPSPPVR